MDTQEQGLAVKAPRKKLRRRSIKERREIVEETFVAGASVSRVARRHDVNANQVFYWRKLYREGRLGAKQLLAVEVTKDRSASVTEEASVPSSGSIEIQARQRVAAGFRKHRCVGIACGARVSGRMIGVPAGTRIWIAAGVTDLRRGFTGLSGMVQTALKENPFSGHVFVFRGRRGDLIKMLWWDGDGLCLFAKRIERGKFTWPQATSGTVALTPAQLSMLLEGIDWRRPVRSYDPQMAV